MHIIACLLTLDNSDIHDIAVAYQMNELKCVSIAVHV